MPQGADIRQLAEQLQRWLGEGPKLCRRLLDRIRTLQEEVEAGTSEIDRLREEIDRLGRELTAARSENEQLRGEREEWATLVETVNQATHRMNELIVRLRGSREWKS